MKPILIPLLLALAAAAACSKSEAESPKPEKTSESAAKRDAEPRERDYTLVYLKTGPKDSAITGDERKTAFAGHMSNMQAMFEKGQLVVAGPFGKQRHDPTLRGIFVLDTAKQDEARDWAASDPTTVAEVFVQELHEFRTAAPLDAAVRMEKEREAAAKASGAERKPGEGMRSYVILHVDDKDAARRELAPLLGEKGVFLLAEVDGKHGFALLDAQDIADAQARYAETLAKLGEHDLDEWFATDVFQDLHGS